MKRVAEFFDPIIKKLKAIYGKLSSEISRLLKPLSFLSPYLSPLAAFILALSVSLGSSFCVISAHRLPVSTVCVTLVCISFSLISSALFSSKLSPAIYAAVGAAALLAGVFARRAIAASFRLSAADILSSYREFWDFLPDYTYENARADSTLFILCLALPLAVLTAWCVLRGTLLWPTVGLATALLVLSINCFDDIPQATAILTVITALMLLLLTHSVRQHSAHSGAVLTFRLLPAALLITAVLAAIVSPSTYHRPEWIKNAGKKIETGIFEFFSGDNPFSSGSGSSYQFVKSPGTEVDMSLIGPNRQYGASVMTVRSSVGGTFYLRGEAFDDFQDNRWLPLPKEKADYLSEQIGYTAFNTAGSYECYIGTIHIQTAVLSDIIYTPAPYYPSTVSGGFTEYGDAYVTNSSVLGAYAIDFCSEPPEVTLSSFESYNDNPYSRFVYENYLSCPDDTSAALMELAEQAGIAALPDEQLPQAVSDYVKSCAEYSLDAPQMPEGKDFAVWFLTEADCGYCMHYATAAALMLRTLGIPARYVTGYYVTLYPDTAKVVLSDYGHAWVEYYSPSKGWLVLDPTPASDSNETSATSRNTSSTAETTTASSSAASSAPTSSPTSSPSVPGTSSSDAPPQSSGFTSPDPTGTGPQVSGDGSSIQGNLAAKYILRAIAVLSAAALTVLAFAVARGRALTLRKKHFSCGQPNDRALAMWTHIQKLCSEAQIEPPDSLHQLALKARFSQHTISDTELEALTDFIAQTTGTLTGNDTPLTSLKRKYFKHLY